MLIVSSVCVGSGVGQVLRTRGHHYLVINLGTYLLLRYQNIRTWKSLCLGHFSFPKTNENIFFQVKSLVAEFQKWRKERGLGAVVGRGASSFTTYFPYYPCSLCSILPRLPPQSTSDASNSRDFLGHFLKKKYPFAGGPG